jgi:hypothetical protein
LFNLKNDPYEKNNLSSAHPDKVEELIKRYENYATSAVPALSKPKPENFKPRDVWGDFND